MRVYCHDLCESTKVCQIRSVFEKRRTDASELHHELELRNLLVLLHLVNIHRVMWQILLETPSAE